MKHGSKTILTVTATAFMFYLSTAVLCAETTSENDTIEQDNGGIAIRKHAKHPKPRENDPCPKAVAGYSISPREAVNEASIRDWAHNGIVRYQALLGAILLEGRLAKRDPQEASYWLNCAAQEGDADAALNLALQIYYADGIEQDFARVAKLAKQSALAGSIMGQRLLGNMYSSGQGVPKDIDEAVRWHTMVAE
jgi:TPR repeat protein